MTVRFTVIALHLPHVNFQAVLERKHKVILSLNLKMLASRVDDLKVILILQN